MKRVLVLGVAACSRPTAPAAPTEGAVTPLEVVVLDDYGTREACDGVAPRQLAIAIDGRAIGTVTVPCRTAVAMPPPQVEGPRVTLPAGTHVVRVHELGGTAAVEKTITLPVIIDDELATRLPVWASDDELDVASPKLRITFE